MAIELNTGKVATQIAGETRLAEGQVATDGAKLGPILDGASVTVTSGAMTDLEKLVARLKNESDDAKMSVTQRRIAVLQTVLDTMADRITEKERENIYFRLSQGRELAKQKGVKMGRKAGSVKSLEQKEQEYARVIKLLRKGDMSLRNIAKVCDVSLSTVQRVKATFQL